MRQKLSLFPRPWSWSVRQAAVQIMWGVFVSVAGELIANVIGAVWQLGFGLSDASWIEMVLLGSITPFLLTAWMTLLAIAGQWWRNRNVRELILVCLLLVCLAGMHTLGATMMPWQEHPLPTWSGLGLGVLIWALSLSPRMIARAPEKVQALYLDLSRVFPTWQGRLVGHQVSRQGPQRIYELLEEEQYTECGLDS